MSGFVKNRRYMLALLAVVRADRTPKGATDSQLQELEVAVQAILDRDSKSLPAGGPPTPDLAAQPDSNKKTYDSLGSSVAPGSESALREELIRRLDWALDQIRTHHRNFSFFRTDDRKLTEAQTLVDRLSPPSGSPTPDLAAQPDSTSDNPLKIRVEGSLGSSVPLASESALREGLASALQLVLSAYTVDELTSCLDRHHGYFKTLIAQAQWMKTLAQNAGGPPTPDLAAQPDSTSVDRYESLVSHLRFKYRLLYRDFPLARPSEMIDQMAGEIQRLRYP